MNGGENKFKYIFSFTLGPSYTGDVPIGIPTAVRESKSLEHK